MIEKLGYTIYILNSTCYNSYLKKTSNVIIHNYEYFIYNLIINEIATISIQL
jgi:hypothetical protein